MTYAAAVGSDFLIALVAVTVVVIVSVTRCNARNFRLSFAAHNALLNNVAVLSACSVKTGYLNNKIMSVRLGFTRFAVTAR